MVDPFVRWGFANNGAIRWSELGDLDDQNIMEQSLAYDMAYGVAIATETDGSRSVAGFAHPEREFTDTEIDALKQHVQDLHVLTASKDGKADNVRAELQSLSVKMTHKPTSKG